VVTTDANIKQKREKLVRFLRGWNRALKFYRDNPEIMLPYIQKKLAIKDAALVRRMYEDDIQTVSLTGRLSAEAEKEILDTGLEALRIKEAVPAERIFDFSLADAAVK
jgi:ABC-type nitrate/sulfonate/bicarbonate transport system substrate-binding protein